MATTKARAGGRRAGARPGHRGGGAGDRKRKARAALEKVPTPKGSVRTPRAGSLKSAALVVVRAAGRALTTREVAARIGRVPWAPVGWSERRLATALGQMVKEDGLLAPGPPAPREGDVGPLERKTWRWKM